MNVAPGSVPHWLNISYYDNYNNNSSNGSSDSTISNNATTNINGSTQGNSTPQLWDLRWFALLSGPLLFGTIILPLITGPTIRYLCQSYVKLRVYWRLGFVLLATVSLITCLVLNLINPEGVGYWIFVVAYITTPTVVIYQTISAWSLRKSRRIWFFRLSLVVSWLCFLINWGVDFTTSEVPIPLGLTAWVAFIVVRMIFSRRERVAKHSIASE